MPRHDACSAFEERIAKVKQLFGNEPDFIVRQSKVTEHLTVCCMYFSTMSDEARIQEYILKPLLAAGINEREEARKLSFLVANAIVITSYAAADIEQCIEELMAGKCLLLSDSVEELYLFDVANPQARSIEEPKTEKIIRGPQEGFTEDLMTSVSLIRKRLKNPDLHFETYCLGQQTNTKVLLVYIANQASETLVANVRKRLLSLKVDSILESANIEEWVQDTVLTPFPTIYNTERPDVVVSHLLERRIAIIVEGTPMALIGPITFFQFFIAPEDYYQRADIATMLRWIRFISFMISVFVPSLYIALVNYHQEVIPNALLIGLAAQRENVPFPAFIEAFGMLLTFELLREAGVRMPKVSGQAISIVGAVVLGQAAVEAGLVSAAMVIVVGITAITNFVTPAFNFGISQRILQFGFMLLAAVLGLFGIMSGIILMVVHLVSLNSFGMPYFSPVAPVNVRKWKDTLVRIPWPVLKQRRKG